MCDTLCVIGNDRTLFAKNSDRSPSEPQVVESYMARKGDGFLRTQYLDIPDAAAHSLLGSRPAWLWGMEHGVNEHRVAIGNEKIWTIDDPRSCSPALIGMDLVRLGLERANTADNALEVITTLLERHGQGGSGELEHDEPYFSSFLIADPHAAWILETSATTWVASPVSGGAAISNRVSISTGWTRSSQDVPSGTDFQKWRDPDASVAIADQRLAATCAVVATEPDAVSPESLVATLRHHGGKAWGGPGAPLTDVSPIHGADLEWEGVTVCMHVGDYQTTTASMIAELLPDPHAPQRAWVALGSPCTSIYVPVFPPSGTLAQLGEDATWERFRVLRDRAQEEPEGLAKIRAVLGPVEDALWQEAEAAFRTGLQGKIDGYLSHAWGPIDGALTQLNA